MIAPAFGDVQVAVFDGRDDGSADGGQVGGAAAGTAGSSVLSEYHVPDMMVRLYGPVLADEPGQVLRAGQAGDGVDGLAGGLAGAGVLPAAGDLDGLAGAGKVQPADVGGFQGPGLGTAVPGLAGSAAGRYLPLGQRLDLCVQQRLVLLHDRDVMGFLLACQPVQLCPHRVEGVEGHHGAV